MATTEKKLPFHLRGNYAPVFDEVEAFDLAVEGSLPAELDGLYVRNGANPHTGTSPHWFAGDGMLHGVRLRDGNAEWYRNRWVRTASLADPKRRTIKPDGTVDHTAGVNNTHVMRHAGRILTLVESSFPCEVDGELNTLGVHDFDGRLDSAMTAHPKICPRTGEMHFFGYAFAPPYLRYHRVDADGVLVQSENIDVAGPTMIHDFSITEHHVIFMDLPVVFDMERAMTGGMPYAWDDTYPARVGVMPRGGAGSETRWFDVDPCYVFHPLNSFERGSEIVMDVARYPQLWSQTASKFQDESVMHRWVLDLDAGTVAEDTLDARPAEFPRLPDALVGLPNRFGYAVSDRRAASSGVEDHAVTKYDLESGTLRAHEYGTDSMPGEVVFVPRAGATAEDDGWLLGYVYDRPTDSSRFVVLDAADIEAAPVASVPLPQRVPFGFHGSWLPEGE